MTVQDVTARIGQIQAQIALLGPPSTAAPGFAAALDGDLASRGVTGRAPATGLAGSTTGSGTAAGEAVVAEARKYLGVPYVWGGTDPATGLDCSGLVQHVYSRLGYDLPRVSYQQARAGRAVGSLDQAQPGDVLAFGSPVHHVAIYLGDNQMIEAPRPGQVVKISPVYETPTAIRRIVPDTAATGVTPYADLFRSASARYGVDATLLAAVARQESGFDPTAVSPAGARGLMQLMPATAAGLGVGDSFDPAQSVDGAARLLRGLLDRFGRTDLALAAYNAGPGAVLRYGGIPPYAETRGYVRNVMSLAGLA